MPLVAVSLADLKMCGFESAQIAFDLEMAAAVKDVCDRPHDLSVRRVVLELHLKPVTGQEGIATTADGEFVVYSRIPKQKTGMRQFALESQNGRLLVRPDEKENVNQTTFMDVKTDGKDESE